MSSDTKTVALSESAYERLKARKREGESFSDVVERLAGERSLLEIVGTGSPDDGYAESVKNAGSSLSEGADAVRESLRDEHEDDT
ncbi:antitoxin VapB family protein [Haladaptatus sp. NG-WS-4]